MMKIRFLGGAGTVTGSKYLLSIDNKKILVDCGLYQGVKNLRNKNRQEFPVDPSTIDAILLTHAHIDHSGYIPALMKCGFKGPVFTSSGTLDLCNVLLPDSGYLQEEDARYANRKHFSKHSPAVPLYTEEDVERTLPMIRGVTYNKSTSMCDGVFQVTFKEAGHILGSAMLEIVVRENNKTQTIVFSGDIGQCDKPIIRDPATFEHADFVVMESTYGDRNHASHGDGEQQLGNIIKQTVLRGGNIVIPTFAVERAQELTYYLSRLVQSGSIPPVPVFLDSPMAVDVTRVFQKHRDCFDQDAWNMIIDGKSILDFPGMHLCRSRDESMQINAFKEPCVIMSTSGMCTAGRIKFHLKRNITNEKAAIVFVGYQAHGTLGRHISQGDESVRIHGRHYDVRAEVVRLSGFSGHTDQNGLLQFLTSRECH